MNNSYFFKLNFINNLPIHGFLLSMLKNKLVLKTVTYFLFKDVIFLVGYFKHAVIKIIIVVF